MESGGLLQNLPSHTFPTDDGGVDQKCPTEIAITDRREKELNDLGFITLCHCKGTDYAAFFGGASAQRAKVYNTDQAHEKIAVAMSQMWKQKLGVEVELSNMEWKVFLEERGNQNFELARGAWCGDYNEASTFLDLLQSDSGYNDGKYANEEYDALLAEAKTAEDTTPLYTQAEEIIAADMPVIPIYHYAGVYMMDSDVGNWPVDNVEQNWYSKNLYKIAE